MRVCGIEIKGNEAIICLLSFSNGLFELPECRIRRLPVQDADDSQSLKAFQSTLAKLFEDYKVENVVIRERPKKGKYSGGAVGFKLEAVIQLIEGAGIELIPPSQTRDVLKETPLPVKFSETGLKAFQENAFLTAYTFLAR